MHSRQTKWTRILTLIAAGYAIGVLIWLGLWFFVGDGFWLLTAFHYAFPVLFIPLPVLALWTVLARGPRWLWPVLLVPLLVFAGFYYPYLVPTWARGEDHVDVSVMTFNILGSNEDYDAIAGLILKYRPDLVALQEVRQVALVALQERLGDVYPYSMLGLEEQWNTTALFSQHPIRERRVLDLEIWPAPLMVQTKIKDTEITFLSVHLLAYVIRQVPWVDVPQYIAERTFWQNRQVELLLEALPADAGVVLLGCDCNTNEPMTSYRMLVSELKNSARVPARLRAPAGTVPDRRLRRLDYVFYRGAVVPLGTYRVLDMAGSDHRAVLALFQFARPAE